MDPRRWTERFVEMVQKLDDVKDASAMAPLLAAPRAKGTTR